MQSSSIACLRSLLLLASLGVLAGCGHVVALHDIQALQPSIVPAYRRVDVQSNEVNSGDIITLSVKSGDKACKVSVRTSCETPQNACQHATIPYQKGEDMVLAGANPRTTAFALGMVRYVEIIADPLAAPCGDAQIIDLGKVVGQPWRVVKRRIEEAWRHSASRLLVTRTVRPDRRGFPGDQVDVIAESLAEGRDSAYSFHASSERVDEAGRLAIPQLTVPARRLGGNTNAHYAFGQVITQQEASARARILAWNPDPKVKYEQQPTIAHIERCFALRWDESVPESDIPRNLLDEVRSCQVLGIHAYGATSEENKFVRYRLDLHQQWSIVLTDGRTFARVLVPGESIADAVRRAVRELRGRDDLLPTYAVVDPRPELRERPFAAMLNTREGLLDNLLLISGDVVHLSNFSPIRMK